MRFHLVAAAGALSIVASAQAQDWPGISARRAAAGVEVLDSPNASPRRVFTDTLAWGIHEPSVSPGQRFLAVVRMEHGVIEGYSYGKPPYPTLVIIDVRTGSEWMRIPGGYASAWCGNSCLAVLYGVYSEDSEVGEYGDSAAVFDVSERRRVRAFERGSEPFYAPRFIPSDSSVIFGGIYGGPRVDLRTGRVGEMRAPAPNLSGSGRWIIELSNEEYRPIIRAVDHPEDSVSIPIAGEWQAEEWLGRTDKVLLLFIPPRRPSPPGTPNRVRPRPPRDPNAPPPERTYRVWDLATGKVSTEWRAAETQWRGPAPSGCRLFLKEGRLTAVPGCR